jgi:hypothetical protein
MPAYPRAFRTLGDHVTVVQALLLALVFASPLAAQNADFNGDVDLDSVPSAPSQAKAVASPKTGGKVFDKKFFFVMGALGGAESLRFTSRKLVLEHEYAAGAPWVASVPPNQHVIAKDLLLYGSEFLVAYELKKPHSWLRGDRYVRKLWWVYPAVMTAIHIKNGVGNIGTQGPGGCTTVECAMQMQNP